MNKPTTVLIISFLLLSYLSYSQDYPSESHEFIFNAHNIPEAWTISLGGTADYPVAFTDPLGFSDLHPDVAGVYTSPIPNNCYDPTEYHGTQAVAAIAGVIDDNCVSGVAYNTSVGAFCDETSFSTMGSLGYKIICSSGPTTGLDRTVAEQLTDDGVTLVLSQRGYKHEDYHDVPGVIVVGRADTQGNYWQYGPNGDGYLDVLFMTEGIYRVIEGSGCDASETGGTSIGTPHVAGIVKLIKDVNPCLFPSDIEHILKSTASPAGLIDVYGALIEADPDTYEGVDHVLNGDEEIEMARVSGDLTVTTGSNITLSGNLQTGKGTIITVESGASLTVTGTIEFGSLAEVRLKRGAKMFVNGGVLTSRGCDGDEWQGIFVEGISGPQQLPNSLNFNPNGNAVLVFTNNAFVEKAKTVFSTNCVYIPYSERAFYRGGYVSATNTIFSSSRRVGEFMKRRAKDNSNISNCTIQNVDVGFTHWANWGVEYKNNTFKSYKDQALLGIDASISVLGGNVFESNLQYGAHQAAIILEGTSANFFSDPPVIGSNSSNPNSFIGGHTGIICSGISGKQLEITNNIFLGGTVGVKITGGSEYSISKNDFYGQRVGTFLEATNSGLINSQRDNNFSSCDYAIMANYDNDRYVFEDNCFEHSKEQDVIVVASGNSNDPYYTIARINSDIGSELQAAGNTFTLSSPIWGSISTNTPDLTSYVTYHMHPDTEGDNLSRKIPNPIHEVADHAFDSQLDSNGDCGSGWTVGPVRITYNYDCDVPLNPVEREEYQLALMAEYAELNLELDLQEPYSLEWWLIRYQMTQIESCIIFSSPLHDLEGLTCDSLATLHSTYEQLPISVRTRLFGALRQLECCTMMETLADTTRTFVNDVDHELTHVHSIVYDLECGNNRDISEDRIERLYDFAVQSHIPETGFARGLYHLITGNRIVVNIPDVELEVNHRESTVLKVDKPYLSCNPNPTLDRTNICKVTTPYSGLFNVTVYNQTGSILIDNTKFYSELESKTLVFDIDSKGLVFVVLRDSKTNEMIDQLILVKL